MNNLNEILTEVTLFLEVAGFTACGLVSLILLSRQRGSSRDTFLLGLSLACLAYTLFHTYLIDTGNIIRLPHLFRVSGPFNLAYMPFSYLYVRTVVTKKTLRATDLIFFLPSVLYVINFLPVFFLPISEKRPLIVNSTIHVLDRVDEGWFFPAYFFRFMLYVLGTLFWLAQTWVVYGMIRRNRTSGSANRSLSGWLVIYTILQALLIFPALGIVLTLGQQANIWFWYTLPASLIGLMTGGILLLKPAILYGPADKSTHMPLQSPAADLPTVADRPREELPQLLIDSYNSKLRFLLEEKKVFLQSHYTLPLLSQESGIPLHQLSAFINRYENANFNEYINRYRIEYAQRLLADPTQRRKTLEAIAWESGFNTRASFISAFKKTTGHTPSEHLRALNGPKS